MHVPLYPASRPLDLGDKPTLDRMFALLQPRVSELTFANLYLFRKAHDYRLSQVKDVLVIFGKGYKGEEYFLPPVGGDPMSAVGLLLGDGLVMYGADENFVESYLRGPGINVTEDRDNADYLYVRTDLAELPGNRFHKKKNRINYFAARHDYRVELFGEEHRDGCGKVVDEWERVHGRPADRSLLLEAEASREAVQLADRLGLKGVVAMVEGEVKGFALGEMLNRDTCVCQFEKGDPFLEGLYQLINREFSRLLFTDCSYVNREQDLGKPNLREAKLSYHPVELVRKFRVRKW